MMKISKLNKNVFFKGLFSLVILVSLVFNPLKVFAEIAETEINGELKIKRIDNKKISIKKNKHYPLIINEK